DGQAGWRPNWHRRTARHVHVGCRRPSHASIDGTDQPTARTSTLDTCRPRRGVGSRSAGCRIPRGAWFVSGSWLAPYPGGRDATSRRTTRAPTVFAVSKKALRNLSFPVDDPQVATPTEGNLNAGDAKVRVERLPGGTTRVRASVGTFDTKDNERRAKLI